MGQLKELLYTIGELFAVMAKRVLAWFLGLEFINQAILLNGITSFLAIIFPIGKYYIFETWFEINNPQAVYLIGIVFIMIATMYIPYTAAFVIRLVSNLWYLIWILIVSLTGSISHAPYEISMGYFFNIAAPVIYLILSGLYYFNKK
jgi:hypothetical protein